MLIDNKKTVSYYNYVIKKNLMTTQYNSLFINEYQNHHQDWF